MGWLVARPRPTRAAEQASADEQSSSTSADSGDAPPVIQPDTVATLLVIADVIVPRYGDSPAASEIGLIPKLEKLIRDSPARAAVYRQGWRELAEAIQEEVPVVDGKPDPDELASQIAINYRRYRQRRKSGRKLG
ncbi:MAG: gluconate 2-dehydrogenase subunit 3 family protein, partial [bacterium]|nr:gluconate 2-dehydrogenase subunit 3 family protein [bacterium]